MLMYDDVSSAGFPKHETGRGLQSFGGVAENGFRRNVFLIYLNGDAV